MSVFGDPTPCPLPRHGALKNYRLSVLNSADASVTLPEAPRAPGLHDAKPRRPQKRQSVRWDPTVDIYEDTFAVSQPAQAPAEPAQRDAHVPITTQPPKVSRRSSTLFAQPAQRVSIATSTSISKADSPKKRRLSCVAEQDAQEAVRERPRPNIGAPSRPSALQKEARRRTIYVPNDTTVFTIHPGASLQNQQPRTARPRQSDVFLDLATVTESTIRESRDEVQEPPVAAVPRKRTSRASLAGAPRRAPLQPNGRLLQQSTIQHDIAGQNTGKENVPPGGVTAPKRLGKRASLILPEKPMAKPSVGLAPVGEHSELKIEEEEHHSPPKAHRRPAPQTNGASRQSLAGLSVPRRLSTAPSLLSGSVVNRRSSLAAPNQIHDRARAHEKAPTSLSVPKLSNPTSNASQRYSALAEDIAHPELYEENWLSHQEQSITQLVNSLFAKARGDDTHTAGRKSVRQSLLNLYHDSENVLLHKRLQASLRFGALSIPPETLAQVARFKDDFGQRQRFLDLWTKTYDLESLQTAAEIVVGRRRVSTPRNSGNGSPGQSCSSTHRAKSTAKFLQTFLVQNQDLTSRASINVNGPPSPSAKGFGPSAEHCWRRTALRSLMIIHLLDAGQRQGVFQGRNLFQASSPYKSSLAVLHGLCRLIIPSVGDVSRVIGHLGYYVGHVQYPLEEFEYGIDNLAVDLRDGVRLTRLVECLLYPPGSLDLQKDGLTVTLTGGDILTSRLDYNGTQGNTWPLSQHLKYPCIGKPQRVYNVEIALAALSGVNDSENLLRDFTASDIVDGHREKTVKLLWGLVSRWGLGSLVDFGLVEHEIKRLGSLYSRRQDGKVHDLVDDAELPYLSEPERQSQLLLSWAQRVGRLHSVTISNLTTSFASGAAYEAIAKQYAASLVSAPAFSSMSVVPPTTLHTLLTHLGTTRTFLTLFHSSTCPSKTTTTSLLAFLASRILPIAVPCEAARTVQRAYRGHLRRWETRKRVVCRCLAEECRSVVEAQRRVERAVRVLQRFWRGAVERRRRGERRWV